MADTKTSAAKKAPQSMDVFLKGLWRENPVFVMLLGMCPVLAVTNSVTNAIAMGLASTFVLFMSSTIVSLVRSFIPKQVRIASFILIIATFVTVVEYLIQAISIDLHKALGAFISLIVVNCMILGRSEAFASKNNVGKSMLDALGMGFGFTIACFSLGLVREVLGAGTLAGFQVLPDSFEPWS
ncbi:MAG: electron transport complex subunit RsxE, partial [Candidatus Latescibacterota bacterium]